MAVGAPGGCVLKPYPQVEDLLRPVLRVAMPRAQRLYAPGGTVHVVARCNNRDFYFTTSEDFELLLAHLREMVRTYEVTLYAYTLMSNHVHLLLQAPKLDALGRPLRWFMTESAKAFHRARDRRGHFWERRYRGCLVEDDTYALAALRYLDRNPVRAGLVDDPTTYPWSSCAAYALGTPNRVISFHPSYLALSPYAKVRQRQYRALLAPSPDPKADARDTRWSTQRAVGSPAFVARYVPAGGDEELKSPPRRIKGLGAKWCPVPFFLPFFCLLRFLFLLDFLCLFTSSHFLRFNFTCLLVIIFTQVVTLLPDRFPLLGGRVGGGGFWASSF